MSTPSSGTSDTTKPTNGGLQFPVDDSGQRSTTSFAKDVLADAFSAINSPTAQRVQKTSDWRQNYIGPFTELVEAGADDASTWNTLASAALDSVHTRMEANGAPLRDYLSSGAASPTPFTSETLTGTAKPVTEFSLPYHGKNLTGTALSKQLDRWVESGIIEPSCADALTRVQENPQWLALPGRTMLVLGLGSEMGPARCLLTWGADVMGVDLPSSPVWADLRSKVDSFAGTLHIPVRDGKEGADLLNELPELAAWVRETAERAVTIGTYLYADGGTHVRLSAAADALSKYLLANGTATALAYLATPMDTFVVPPQVRAHANALFDSRARLTDLRALSGKLTGHRLFHRNYKPGSGPGIHDALVPQQGPNYTLAKRIQRWRATTALADGQTVSITVAPSTRTRSVTKNKGLALAYRGASAFGIEIFEPDTASTMLAALLVHDLNTEVPEVDHPWNHEARNAASGGLWRQPYLPRTALTVAAVLGMVKR